jgi:hypothetical protein
MVKRTTSTAFLVLCLALSVLAKKPLNFSGSWELDRVASTLGDAGLWLEEIKVTQTKDSLLTYRTYQTNSYEEYPFTENLTLDGKEYEITIYEMPRKTLATVSDDKKNLVIKSQVTFWGDNGEVTIPSTETWSLQEKGKVLAIEYMSVGQDGEYTSQMVYKKVKKEK